MTEETPQEQKEITTKETLSQAIAQRDQMVQDFVSSASPYSKKAVTKKGIAQLKEFGEKGMVTLNQSEPAFQLLTVHEFSSSILLSSGIGEAYKALVTEMSAQLQHEFRCETHSQKATAHLVAQNFGRLMELQREISTNLNRGEYSEITLKRLSILNKAYDQANRQYLLSLQSLQMIHQPPMNVIVKTTTANIANNQFIQENHEA